MSKTTQKNSAFTLVELLVVIAIIGVLSGVVIASLGLARQKASNTAIKANLSSLRSSAEIVLANSGNTYGTQGFTLGTCPIVLDTTVFGTQQIIDGIASALRASGTGGTATCVSTPSAPPVTTWAVSVKLKTPETINGVTSNYWCVDYLANAKGEVSDLVGADASCL